MPLLPFGEYRPDISDYEGQTTKNIQNVLPRGDGYGPFPDFAILSQALTGACRGAFYALKSERVPGDFFGGESVGPLRVNVSTTTTYYLVARAIFTVSTMTATGKLRARRINR